MRGRTVREGDNRCEKKTICDCLSHRLSLGIRPDGSDGHAGEKDGEEESRSELVDVARVRGLGLWRGEVSKIRKI